jgi:farnesyl-diphosphate farnesyltransferase
MNARLAEKTASAEPALPVAGAPPGAEDLALQDRLLQGVSRTFALTIPQAPEALRDVVGNAYLLCRTVDTIEDEPGLDAEATRSLAEEYVDVVNGRASADAFAARLAPQLTEATLPAERELIARTPTVIAILRSFTAAQQAAVCECVEIMARGMVEFQQTRSLGGLEDLRQTDRYCYHVAGVVGEMLTKLFCDHVPEMSQNRERLLALGVSFGQGLQMTNILKDVWEDRRRGACWLPRSVFAAHGFDLHELSEQTRDPGFTAGLLDLVGVTHRHLRDALEYTLLIPPREQGMRNFCLWAIGMALLTLRKINRRPDYRAGEDVKISRRSVYATILVSRMSVRHDRLLRRLFAMTAAGLPLRPAAEPLSEGPR